MNKRFLVVLSLWPVLAHAEAPKLHSHDYRPNPDFVSLRAIDDTNAQGGIYQLGEVAILEGDFGLVSYGSTGYGIVTNSTASNHSNITKRFLSKYADQFDEIILFTTFEDRGNPGALAYEFSV